MEDYEEMENDALDAFDASDATATTTTPMGIEQGISSRTGQIRHEVEAEPEKSRLENVGVLRATSGNATRRLNSRVTRAGKSAEAVIKQFANQELQGEKKKIQEWKENVMREVGLELQDIRQRQEEAMEAQRQNFQMELEKVRELWELNSKSLENEIRLLKTPGQHPALKMQTAKTA